MPYLETKKNFVIRVWDSFLNDFIKFLTYNSKLAVIFEEIGKTGGTVKKNLPNVNKADDALFCVHVFQNVRPTSSTFVVMIWN